MGNPVVLMNEFAFGHVEAVGIVVSQSVFRVVFPDAEVVVEPVVFVERSESVPDSIGEDLQLVHGGLVVAVGVVVFEKGHIEVVGSDYSKPRGD